MQLPLPSGEIGKTKAWLLLERGDLAGKRYELTFSICSNPVCECAIVLLRCTPVDGESQPRSSSVAVSLEMDVVENRIANLEKLNRNSDAAAVARAVSSEMTESHWNRLRRLYFGAKRRYTETTPLDQIDAQFPAELIAQRIMVCYHEILPYAAPVEVSSNGRSWLFDDQYCVRPECSCRDAIVSFHPLPTRNETGTKPLTKLQETSYISVCYHYDSGDVEILPDSRHREATGRELIAALRQQQPDVDGFLAKRHGVLRQLYRRYSMKRTTVRKSGKSGRNDPCPCGSGKKLKKCCGA
jgi:SEC-C motif-containing protein